MINIYSDEEARAKHLKRYFTEYGIECLERRLNSIAEMRIKNIKYPFTARINGFPTLRLQNKDHHDGVINELLDLLGKRQVTLNKNDH